MPTNKAYFDRDLKLAALTYDKVYDLDHKEKVFVQQFDGSYIEAWILDTVWDTETEIRVHLLLLDEPYVRNGVANTRFVSDNKVMRKEAGK